MARSEINVSSLDHDELKESLVQFLKSTDEFSDFNYEGSAINTLLDLQTRNTSVVSFLANMIANESFIQSAQKRGNVVSHSEKLSYTPRSNTASRIEFSVTVKPSNIENIPTSIVMDRGTVFLASVNGETFSFVTQEDYVLTFRSSVNGYFVSNVIAYQGQIVTNRFIHSDKVSHVIPNANVDTSTLIVTVEDKSQIDGKRTYRIADDITELGSSEPYFFLSENHKGFYQIEFGRNIIGIEPPDGSIVEVSYINTEEDFANGVKNLIAGSLVSGYPNISIDVTAPAYGGQERDDIERIRFLAPKAYQAQKRAVNEDDYIPLIKTKFPFVKSGISWGGEKNEPPQYGNVFLSILSDGGGVVTDTVKNQIVSFVSDYNVGSITPIVVDSENFYIDLTIKFVYDNRKTSKTFNEITKDIVEVVNAYETEYLKDFKRYFNKSLLNQLIMKIKGVTSVSIDTIVSRELTVQRFNNPVYQLQFKNEIEPESISMTGFLVDVNAINTKLYDDGAGNIMVSYEIGGEKIVNNVGNVDYTKGMLEFTLNMIQENTNLNVYIKTLEDNFYVRQNGVVNIGEIQTSLLNTGEM